MLEHSPCAHARAISVSKSNAVVIGRVIRTLRPPLRSLGVYLLNTHCILCEHIHAQVLALNGSTEATLTAGCRLSRKVHKIAQIARAS